MRTIFLELSICFFVIYAACIYYEKYTIRGRVYFRLKLLIQKLEDYVSTLEWYFLRKLNQKRKKCYKELFMFCIDGTMLARKILKIGTFLT